MSFFVSFSYQIESSRLAFFLFLLFINVMVLHCLCLFGTRIEREIRSYYTMGMYCSYSYDKYHDQKQLEEKTYFSMWFQRNRVHHGEEGMVWCQKQEADRSHLICT